MGTPDFAVPALENISKKHEIVAVYTQPPRPKGRGQKLQKSPVHIKAEELGISVFTPKNFKEENDIKTFQNHNADFAVVVAYGLILPPAIFEAPKINTVNIHASLLPRWRGADPIRRAIMAGDSETGICIMKVEKGLDTGEIYLEESVPIIPDDIAENLHDILSIIGANLVLQYLDNYKTIKGKKQIEEGTIYAHKLIKKDFEINWKKTATDIYNQIRALSPKGAIFNYEGEQIKVKKSKIIDEKTEEKIGTILSDNLQIACGNETVLQLEILQKSGKKAMPRKDFLKGFSLSGRLS
ncbi:MAG: methionyl-tRNA formyltransferase [Alphaproteobacteria bacterium]